MRVIIHDISDGEDKADSFFSDEVAWSSFTAEEVSSGWWVIGVIRFKIKILVNDVEDIHKLAFIGMDTFNLDIEEGVRVGRDILLSFNEIGEGDFTDNFNILEILEEGFIGGDFVKEFELFRVTVPDARADCLVDKVCEFWVSGHKPATVGNAVSFIIEHSGPILVEVVECGRLKDI